LATFLPATVKEAVAGVEIKKEEEITKAGSSIAGSGTVEVSCPKHPHIQKRPTQL
jgi:hypothetical protein